MCISIWHEIECRITIPDMCLHLFLPPRVLDEKIYNVHRLPRILTSASRHMLHWGCPSSGQTAVEQVVKRQECNGHQRVTWKIIHRNRTAPESFVTIIKPYRKHTTTNTFELMKSIRVWGSRSCGFSYRAYFS